MKPRRIARVLRKNAEPDLDGPAPECAIFVRPLTPSIHTSSTFAGPPALVHRPPGWHTLTGNFRLHPQFPSQYSGRARDVLVYLPPGYEQDQSRRYPVLYMHDGQNVFDAATSPVSGKEWQLDESAEWLIHSGQIEPILIVAVYNAGADRIQEYTPTQDSRSHLGGGAAVYGRMLVDELKPFIDAEYRTLADSWNTGLGGSSLGGLVTAYLGLCHPEVFGKLAVLSPSVWWDSRSIVRFAKHLEGKSNSRIWLDIGTAEGRNPNRIVKDVRELRNALLGKGWRIGEDLAYVEASGGRHSEDDWARRCQDVLRFLFPAD